MVAHVTLKRDKITFRKAIKCLTKQIKGKVYANPDNMKTVYGVSV